MKLKLMVVSGILLLAAQVGAEETLVLKTQNDNVNYGIGVEFARSLKRQGVEVKLDVLLKGLKDELSGGELLMTERDLRKTMIELQLAQKFKKTAMRKPEPEANRTKGEAFLAENRTKPGVVALPSGLQYVILKPGDGRKPMDSDTVECYYRGTLIDGVEIDSSYQGGQPATFKVSEAIFPGLNEALKLMPKGSKWRLFIPPQLAYGTQGNGRVVGPNETLIYAVELLSIK